MNRHSFGGFPPTSVDRAWYGVQAPEGSSVGDQLKFQFVHDFHNTLGDVRLLFMPDGADTTTNSDLGVDGVTWTYDATVAGNLTRLGSGMYWSTDGTADEADTPDDTRHSFGDSTLDGPFSVGALVRVTAGTVVQDILSKYSAATGAELREWRFGIDASEFLFLECWDESANAAIGRRFATALAVDTWMLVVGVYRGTRVADGIDLYLYDGTTRAVVDNTDQNTLTYVAMENLTSVTKLASSQGASAITGFWAGDIAMVWLTASAPTSSALWAIRSLVNSYFDLNV